MAEGGTTLEYTPTWVVALVCTFIVAISFAIERLLHSLGHYLLKKEKRKPLFEALQKIKEELMLLGFISLLLSVFQTRINKICIPKHLSTTWLPCAGPSPQASTAKHLQSYFNASHRHLLAAETVSDPSSAYCNEKGKVPLLSVTALHHLHIFIFVLAFVHVVFCALTIFFGSAKLRQWKDWEEAASKQEYDLAEVLDRKVTHVHEHDFIKKRFLGIGKDSAALSWLLSFFKQFYGSVNKSDYITLRTGFIMNHCPGNRKFNFHKYMMRALEADFNKVVGISWYLWLFVIVFLLLNVHGWHAYFWISFVPFLLLLCVGTKLEHIITQLAQEVAEKHVAVEGDLVVRPSDDHFWFHRPQIILVLIHILLFQNAFEVSFFFFVLFQYKFDSCIMGQVGYTIPRLVIGVFVQFVCSYSTLPLYAIVAQMGSSFSKVIFEDHIQQGLVGWAKQAKRKTKGFRKNPNGPSHVTPKPSELSSPESSALENEDMRRRQEVEVITEA